MLDPHLASSSCLPSLAQSPDGLMDFPGEALGEVVGALLLGVHPDDDNSELTILVLVVPGPEEVMLHMEVLGPGGDVLIHCEQSSGIIVFMDGGRDGRPKQGTDLEHCDNLQKHSSNRNEIPEALRETGVLGLTGGAADVVDQLGLPIEGTST